MADVELQGRIDFNADTSEAEKNVGGVADKSGSDFGKSFSKSIGDSVKKMVQGVFGNADLSKKFGTDVGKSIGESLLESLKRLVSTISPPKITPLSSTGGFQVPSWTVPGAAATGAGGDIAAANAATFARFAAVAGPIALGVAAGFAQLAITLGAMAAVTYKVIDIFVGLAKSLIEFSRTLADVSPSMAMVFAQFDLQMMMLKRDLGESLAPIIGRIMRDLADLARNGMPVATFALSRFAASVEIGTYYVDQLSRGFDILGNYISSLPGFNTAKNAAMVGAGAILNLGPLIPILHTINQAAEQWMNDRGANKSANVFGAFNDYMIQQGSEQQRASDRLHQARAQRNHDLKEGPEFLDLRLRGQ